MTDPRKRKNPRTVNEIILDREIRHAVYLQRLAGGEAKWVRENMSRIRRAITKEIAPLLAEIDTSRVLSVTDQMLIEEISNKAAEASREFFEEIAAEHIRKLGDIVIAEADFERRIFQRAIPVQMNFKTPSDLFLTTMMQTEAISGKTMTQWFREMPANTRFLVNEQIREGMIQGESMNEILDRVRGTRQAGFRDGVLGKQSDNAEALVRTGVMRASAKGRDAFHEENKDVIKGWSLVLTLDSDTCMICVDAESMNPYPLENKPETPLHIRCRCLVTAVVKSWEELGIDLDEAEPGTRASMDGQVPDTMTYEEWFDRQSATMQEDILGPGRYELYKGGKPVAAFADRGQIITLEELTLIDPI